MCSNICGGSCTPDAANRSVHFGRMPVALNRPRTRPSSSTPSLLEDEDVLHGDDVALHAGDLRNGGDLARAVRQARDLHDELDGRRDLLADGAIGNVQIRHGDHGVEPIQRVTRAVGVNGRQAAVVARVHRLQHVERFFAANLADDDAIGPHTQGVDDQLALANCAFALRCSAAAFRAARRDAAAASVRPNLRSSRRARCCR